MPVFNVPTAMFDEEKIPRITFDSKDSWLDYHLLPTSRVLVVPPSPKLSYLEVPGSSGTLDFTTALDGNVHYNNRQGDWEFFAIHEVSNYDWSALYRMLLTDLQGKKFKIGLSTENDDPKLYYFGRVWLDQWLSDPDRSRITIGYDLEPYRYPSLEDREARRGGVL